LIGLQKEIQKNSGCKFNRTQIFFNLFFLEVYMSDKNEVKALLARAGVEINTMLKSVDNMSQKELDSVANLAPAAFFDFNGACAAPSKADLVAFFDFNGVCAGKLDTALDKVLVKRIR
jgi:hypothetical protein